MIHTKRLTVLLLMAATVALPACGLQGLIVPLIERGLDEIFNKPQEGDLVPDDTAIGEAVDLEISLGGRFCCDTANGTDQRVAIVTIRHAGTDGSDPITYQFLPDTVTKLSASPTTGTLAPGEVASINIYSTDCDYFVQDFRMRTYFVGEQGVPGRSTTALLTVRNLCDDEDPTTAALLKLLADPGVQSQLADSISLVEYGDPVRHGNVAVPDRIPNIRLSEISYYGSLEVNLDATAIQDAFTGVAAAFPIGTQPDASVYAADTPATMTPGDYRMIFFGLDGSFDLIDTSRIWRFGVVADSDGESADNFEPDAQNANDAKKGTDSWYLLDYAPGSGWNVRLLNAAGNELASAVRVIKVADALLFIIPKSELPGPGAGYRVLSFTHTGDDGLGADHDWSGDHHSTPNLVSLPD